MNIVQEPEYALFTNGYNTEAPIYNDPRAYFLTHSRLGKETGY